MGKVTRLAVAEGDHVSKGDFLLEIDPLPYRSVVDQLQAAVRGAEAALQLEQASHRKAKYDYDKVVEIREKGFSSEDELETAKVNLEVAAARVRTARETLSQQTANLKKAQHDLDQVSITADMSGIITTLNVEEGESAIMGTLNNPGTILLTIADLSEMEAEVNVDETEVVSISVGQTALVNLDAYPDTAFAGVVTEVGNSAIRSNLGMGQQSVDFEVVISITDQIPHIRPGLSASVDIIVADLKDVVSIPIQCLTIRDQASLNATEEQGQEGEPESRDLEGVFVVEDNKAMFRQVEVGISGESHFEVLRGLKPGEKVVTGPFKAIGALHDQDQVKIDKETKRKK